MTPVVGKVIVVSCVDWFSLLLPEDMGCAATLHLHTTRFLICNFLTDIK